VTSFTVDQELNLDVVVKTSQMPLKYTLRKVAMFPQNHLHGFTIRLVLIIFFVLTDSKPNWKMTIYVISHLNCVERRIPLLNNCLTSVMKKQTPRVILFVGLSAG